MLRLSTICVSPWKNQDRTIILRPMALKWSRLIFWKKPTLPHPSRLRILLKKIKLKVYFSKIHLNNIEPIYKLRIGVPKWSKRTFWPSWKDISTKFRRSWMETPLYRGIWFIISISLLFSTCQDIERLRETTELWLWWNMF